MDTGDEQSTAACYTCSPSLSSGGRGRWLGHFFCRPVQVELLVLMPGCWARRWITSSGDRESRSFWPSSKLFVCPPHLCLHVFARNSVSIRRLPGRQAVAHRREAPAPPSAPDPGGKKPTARAGMYRPRAHRTESAACSCIFFFYEGGARESLRSTAVSGYWEGGLCLLAGMPRSSPAWPLTQ